MDNVQKCKVYDFLDVWKRCYHSDNSEIRQLDFRDRSPGTYDRQTVDRGVTDDDGFTFAAEVTEGAISSLTKNQEISLLVDLGIRTVGIPNHELHLEDALQRIWRALVSRGVCGS